MNVLELINKQFAIYLGIAAGWTTFFSLTINPRVRGLRNLGLLASYLLPIVMLFSVPLLMIAVTWCAFGLGGGLLYIFYDLLLYFKLRAPDKNLKGLPSHLFYGLFAWPIMAPEAIESTLAELHLLPSTKKVEKE